MEGTLTRARDALRSDDFRRLFWMRMLSQSADGLIQAALVASLAFSPEQQRTAIGFAIASAVVIVPYSIIGPFAGVFIDRWSRRAIMVVTPILRAAPVLLLLLSPERDPVLFYGAALWVTSVNRFFLATAQAVVPRLVPTEDLLAANSIATVGGTVALLVGVVLGGFVADAFGSAVIVTAAGVMWLVTSVVASRIRSDLRPHQIPESARLLRHEVRRVAHEFADGIRDIARTPRALGPITSISVDQLVQGLVLVLSLVVFRQRFKEGVGSFSWLIAAGGAGVFLGLLTVGRLDARFGKVRTIAGSFALGGIFLLLVAVWPNRLTILVASFVVGLAFAWKKVPVDTMVQEAVPDGLRGRVFAVYDVAYNLSRLAAAFLAVLLLPTVGVEGAAALMGALLLAWAPVLPRWLRGVPEIRIRFYEGARAEEWPRAVVWGGVEEPVEVRRSWQEERAGRRLVCFRLALQDGTLIEVSRSVTGASWHLDRELGS